MENIQYRDYEIELLDTRQSAEFYHLLNSNRPRLEDFFAGLLNHVETLESTVAFCREIDSKIEERSYFPFIIKNKSTGEFAGLIDIKNISWAIPKAEIGYLIDSKYEGQGIISEGLSKLIDYLIAEYGFKKLLCRAAAKNTGSIKVALKNGFELEGTIRRDYKTTKGEVVDLNYYGRIF